jgi:digeranylgeranylglycerophospholipid reductase
MKKVFDVIVVGGGPSGLNSASLLAEKGFDVLLLERKKAIGHKIICSGIVGREAFGRFDLPSSPTMSEIKEVRMISPYGTQLLYRHSGAFAYVVDRNLFDRKLADRVKANGGRIECGYQVNDIQLQNGRIDVFGEGQGGEKRDFSGRLVIVATGVNQYLNKKVGLGSARDLLNGVQADVEVEDSGITTILFGNSVAPAGFAWAVPAGKTRIKVGLLTKGDPRVYFERLLEKIFPDLAIKINKDQIKFKSIVQGFQAKTYNDRILAVGEAAGQVKTTTGGGIYYGLLCSQLAVETILKNSAKMAFAAEHLAEYERLWKKAILKEIVVGYYTRKICAQLNDSQIEKLFLLAKNNGIFPYIRENGNFDFHGDLILDLARKTPVLRSFF